jgi:hypothetical protein
VTAPPSHRDLLSITAAVRRAAVSGDTALVHAELDRFRVALTRHLAAERDEIDALPGTAAVVARDGQRRLLHLLDDIVEGRSCEHGGCNCLVRTARIEVALRRQARLEANLLWRHADSPQPSRDTHAGRPSPQSDA